MFKRILAVWIAGLATVASAAQIEFDFSQDAVGQPPPGFASVVTGPGVPAHWKVVEEEVAPILPALDPNTPHAMAKRSILSVQSFNMNDGHFPVLLYTNEIFNDFTFTTRFRISGGIIEPSAGIVFRAQDENNYYVIRASTEGNLLWYKVVDGRSYMNLGIGVKLPMDKDAWRELRVECNGSRIRCLLDGRLAIPPAQPGAPTNDLAINDTTFALGKVGFWTRADTKCGFVDASVQYTPRIPYVQTVVNNIIKKYPRLLGLKIYALNNAGKPAVIGDINERGIGAAGTKVEADVIQQGSIYSLKVDKTVEITLPVRDRNGDVVAAIAVKMKSFAGETQNTALERAVIVKKAFEEQVASMDDLKS